MFKEGFKGDRKMRYLTPKPTQTTLILEKLLGGALPDRFVASLFYGLLQACGFNRQFIHIISKLEVHYAH